MVVLDLEDVVALLLLKLTVILVDWATRVDSQLPIGDLLCVLSGLQVDRNVRRPYVLHVCRYEAFFERALDEKLDDQPSQVSLLHLLEVASELFKHILSQSTLVR